MGYFDDPKHRAQWERELTALREEKARLKAGGQPAAESNPAPQMESEKQVEQRVAERRMESVYEEAIPAAEPINEPVYEEPSFTEEPELTEEQELAEEPELFEEPVSETVPQKKNPEKPTVQRVRPDGIYREHITFQELLRQEGLEPHIKLTHKPRTMELTKEVSHEL